MISHLLLVPGASVLSAASRFFHNLYLGLLGRDGDKVVRYSLRGMFFLRFQILRDFVRFS